MIEFQEVEIEQEPLYGPPLPPACPVGWTAHVWTVTIEEGQLSFHTDCVICDRGIQELESEYIQGEFQGRLVFHKETYGWETPETDVWWEVVPS